MSVFNKHYGLSMSDSNHAESYADVSDELFEKLLSRTGDSGDGQQAEAIVNITLGKLIYDIQAGKLGKSRLKSLQNALFQWWETKDKVAGRNDSATSSSNSCYSTERNSVNNMSTSASTDYVYSKSPKSNTRQSQRVNQNKEHDSQNRISQNRSDASKQTCRLSVDDSASIVSRVSCLANNVMVNVMCKIQKYLAEAMGQMQKDLLKMQADAISPSLLSDTKLQQNTRRLPNHDLLIHNIVDKDAKDQSYLPKAHHIKTIHNEVSDTEPLKLKSPSVEKAEEILKVVRISVAAKLQEDNIKLTSKKSEDWIFDSYKNKDSLIPFEQNTTIFPIAPIVSQSERLDNVDSLLHFAAPSYISSFEAPTKNEKCLVSNRPSVGQTSENHSSDSRTETSDSCINSRKNKVKRPYHNWLDPDMYNNNKKPRKNRKFVSNSMTEKFCSKQCGEILTAKNFKCHHKITKSGQNIIDRHNLDSCLPVLDDKIREDNLRNKQSSEVFTPKFSGALQTGIESDKTVHSDSYIKDEKSLSTDFGPSTETLTEKTVHSIESLPFSAEDQNTTTHRESSRYNCYKLSSLIPTTQEKSEDDNSMVQTSPTQSVGEQVFHKLYDATQSVGVDEVYDKKQYLVSMTSLGVDGLMDMIRRKKQPEFDLSIAENRVKYTSIVLGRILKEVFPDIDTTTVSKICESCTDEIQDLVNRRCMDYVNK